MKKDDSMAKRQAAINPAEEINPYGDHDDLDDFTSEGTTEDTAEEDTSSLPWFLRIFRRSPRARRIAEQSAYMIDGEGGRDSSYQEE
jgi:hypothetical protein